MPPTDIVDELDSVIDSAQRKIAAIRAELSRISLRQFVERAWQIVEPNTPYVPNWHIDVLCDVLERITAGTGPNHVIINVPPGTMKTLLISVFWPAWEWATNPGLRYLTLSYSASRTIDANVKLRTLVMSDWYRESFPTVELSSDQNAKERFDTTAEGWRIASSIGGIGTGVHPDRIILDDPMSADQAASDVERKAINDSIRRTLTSRGLSRNAAVILDMQRLHEDDTTGVFLAQGGWDHVCFPMRYETQRAKDTTWVPDARDPRRIDGELLWPALFDNDKVTKLERDLGSDAAGQLQQRPSPEGGNLFKREWFKILDAMPAMIARRVRGWDTAGTEGAGDYSCGVLMAETYESIVIVEDVARGQWSPDGLDKNMKLTAELDGISVPIREEKEPAAAGKAVIAARTKWLKGHDYKAAEKSGAKAVRAKPFRSQCEAGNVFLLRAPWNKAYIDELCDFPNGKNDDQVDGSSCAYNQMLLEPILQEEYTWGR